MQRYVQNTANKTPLAKIVLIFLGLCCLCLDSEAESPQPLLRKADSLYRLGAEEASLSAYAQVLDEHRAATPRMLYRMAYLEENKGRIPQTLYYLSRLYTLTPEEGTRSKIESLARQYKLEGYEADEMDFFRQMLRRYSPHLFGLFTLMVAGLLVILFRRRWRGKPLRLLPLTIVLLLGVASIILNLDIDYGKAVVLHENLPLMTEPAAGSKALDFVPAGTRLTVTGSDPAWYRVLYKGRSGYVSRYWVGYF